MTNKLIKKILNLRFIYLFFISPFLFLFYKLYLQKVSAFGCFDDCFNIVGGYFLKQGKTLYSDIFFNHQPLMAYISFGIQSITDPINIFALILAHRNFIFIFSILMNLIIVGRFKWAGVGFILFYEATKFYVFGDRFLAEAVIVYPLVYLIGLVWLKLNDKLIYKSEYIFSAFSTFIIIFLREPFVPLAMLLFILIIFNKQLKKISFISAIIFIFLTVCFLFTLPLKDYVFNIFTVNRNILFKSEVNNGNIIGIEIIKIFFYPFYIFFDGKMGYFRIILMSLSTLFVFFTILSIVNTKKWREIILIIFILGFANIRYVPPGTVYYEAFHMAPWYGMFIFTIFILFQSLLPEISKKMKYLFYFSFITIFIFMIFPGKSFIWERTDRHTEFFNNYGNYLKYGEASKILHVPKSTLFVDGFDELIYWQANVPSSYRYSWYTSFMPYITIYSQARERMFKRNPPDIYYGSCPKETALTRLIPEESKKSYVNLHANGQATCLFLKKEYVSKISKNQWEKLKEFQFYLPATFPTK